MLTVLQSCQQRLERGSNGAAPKPTPPVLIPDRSLPRTGSGVRGRLYFAHKSAFIDEEVEIGEGSTLWHVSHVLKGSRIGRNCRIGQNVVIGPNVPIGDGVKIQNNVSVYEGVTLEDYVFCGPSTVFTNVSYQLRAGSLWP